MTYGTEPAAGGTPPADDPPHCYRHPDRESYIRCQRCHRPICPDCQTPASVGVHCPDDVKAGARDVRQPRTVLGGMVPRGDNALVTKLIIGITVLVSSADFLLTSRIGDELALVSGVDQPGYSVGVVNGEVWRLVSVALVHGGWFHLLVNMFSLWMLGTQLEPVLGRARFITLYVLGALGGSAASYALNAPVIDGQFLWGSVGASGAIFALLGAMFPIVRRMSASLTPLFAVLGINLYLGFQIAGIDWKAHLGGLLVGAAVGTVITYAPRERRDRFQLVGLLVTLAVVLVVVVARTLQLRG